MSIGMAIVIVASVYFLIVSPGFRKVVGVILVGAVALFVWFIARSNDTSQQWNNPQPQATIRPPSKPAQAAPYDWSDVSTPLAPAATNGGLNAASDDRADLAATEIKAQDLELSDIALRRPSYAVADGGSLDEWLLTGTITNNSKYPLGSLIFEVTVHDCPLQKTGSSSANCRTVGQQSVEVSAAVPARQTRAFSSYALRFAGMPALDRRYQRQFNWTLQEVSRDTFSDWPAWTPQGK
jgi:hypothetical protein